MSAGGAMTKTETTQGWRQRLGFLLFVSARRAIDPLVRTRYPRRRILLSLVPLFFAFGCSQKLSAPTVEAPSVTWYVNWSGPE